MLNMDLTLESEDHRRSKHFAFRGKVFRIFFFDFLVFVEMEGLSICIKIDYLLILYDFFVANLPIQDKITTTSSTSTIETCVDLVIKNPEIILLDTQYDYNSNCLVLNMFEHSMQLVSINNNTIMACNLKELTMYTSNFRELKQSKIKSRVKSFVLEGIHSKYYVSLR